MRCTNFYPTKISMTVSSRKNQAPCLRHSSSWPPHDPWCPQMSSERCTQTAKHNINAELESAILLSPQLDNFQIYSFVIQKNNINKPCIEMEGCPLRTVQFAPRFVCAASIVVCAASRFLWIKCLRILERMGRFRTLMRPASVMYSQDEKKILSQQNKTIGTSTYRAPVYQTWLTRINLKDQVSRYSLSLTNAGEANRTKCSITNFNEQKIIMRERERDLTGGKEAGSPGLDILDANIKAGADDATLV